MKRLTTCSLLLLLISACGGGDGDDDDPAPTATLTRTNGTATATIVSTGTAEEIGAVDNADGDAFVNDRRANQDLALRAGDLITTGSDSSIDFTIEIGSRVECKTLSDSELALRPDGNTLIRWMSRTGVSYCNAEAGPPQELFGIDPDVEIEVEGTLFGVVDGGTLRVVEGFVILRAGGTEQRLGPNQQVSIALSGQPGDRGTWDGLAGDEQQVVDDLIARRPVPFALPTDAEIRQSPLLTSMFDSESILVLLDESAGGDDEDFVRSYFGSLTDTWQQARPNGAFFIEDVQRVSRDEAEILLQQRPNSVYVAPPLSGSIQTPVTPTTPPLTPAATTTATVVPTTRPALDLAASPFYIDAGGQTWSINFPDEPAPVVAFGRFTRAILTTGEYYDLYSPIFGDAPPYDALLSLGL